MLTSSGLILKYIFFSSKELKILNFWLTEQVSKKRISVKKEYV